MNVFDWLFCRSREEAKAQALNAMSAVRDSACEMNVKANLQSKAASDAISDVLKRMEMRRYERKR